MKKGILVVFTFLLGLSLMPLTANAQAVLGACTDKAVAERAQGKASPAWQAVAPGGACESSRVPLPGEPGEATGNDDQHGQCCEQAGVKKNLFEETHRVYPVKLYPFGEFVGVLT